ncbi:MAG: permease, partial [Paracoccaceae bacterium]
MTELVLQQAGAIWRHLRGWDRVWLLILAIPLALVALDPGRAGPVLSTAVRAFGGTVPFMAVAVGLIAWLKATGAEGIVTRAFVGRERRMIVLAALAGGLMPFCSCEVIPFIAALLAAGTPLSAVMAFWLSSPLMDPPQFMITVGALGLEFAVGKVVFAVMIGLAGGFIMQALIGAGAFAEPLKARKGCSTCCSADALTG